MRIAYITHTRFPTEKAHGYQIAQVCSALLELGHEVRLIKPTIWNAITDSAEKYYSISGNFIVEQVRHFDALKSWFVPGVFGFSLGMWFYRSALKKLPINADVLYVRSPIILEPLLGKGIPVVLELHELPRFGRRRFVDLCNRCRLVVCLTSQMHEELRSWGVDARRMITEGDAVRLETFGHQLNIDEAKIGWGLPTDRPIVGYVGSFVTRDCIEKGAGILVEALALLKKQGHDIGGFIVGHPQSWLAYYQRRAADLHLSSFDVYFHDRISPLEVPLALAACNLCVYPAPKSAHPFFQRDTSPLKLFEYLAAGRPVVCANIPPVHDLVGVDTVTFFEPGDPVSLARAILEVLGDTELAQTKVHLGRERAEQHTWKRRMQRILSAL